MEAWHITKWSDPAPGMLIDTASWKDSLYWTARRNGVYRKPLVQPTLASRINELLAKFGVHSDVFNSVDDFLAAGATAAENLKEYVFEHVRSAEFTERPSRMRCTYLWPVSAVSDPIEAAARMDVLRTGTFLLRVELLQPQRAHLADAALLGCNGLTIDEIEHVARRYWTGGTSDQVELLYEGQFRILDVQPLPPAKAT